jgi:acetamidase/formamidase
VLQTRDASDGHLTPEVTAKQAYILCSVAVALRVNNIVDLPNVVSAFLPEDVFTAEQPLDAPGGAL